MQSRFSGRDRTPERVTPIALAPITGSSARGLRGALSHALLRIATFLDGNTYAPILPNAVSSDPALSGAIRRAARLQEMGYTIGFQFLPRLPDCPAMYVCSGKFSTSAQEEQWLSSGFDTSSRALALTKALGETLERLIWLEDETYWKTGSIRASADSLRSPFGPERLSGFSAEQRASNPHFAYRPDTTVLWSRGTRLATGESIYIPSQLISGRHASARNAEPLLRLLSSNGLASHTSLEMARYHGLLELIERDAFMITFNNHISPPRVRTRDIRDADSRALLDDFERYLLECDVLLLPTDMPTSVACAVVRDTTGIGPALTIGAKAHHDPELAVRGALLEAYAIWYIAHGRKLRDTALPAQPWNILERVTFWSKPENTEKLAWLWQGRHVDMPDGSAHARNSRTLAEAAERNDCTVAAITMSNPALERAGFYTVFVVSPELQPLNLDSEPRYLGGTRLAAVPAKLGYDPKPAPPPYPHPFP